MLQNTSRFLHPWATTRAPSKNRKETDCQVSIDQRKCLALIVLGLPIDNHKLLARSSTVILQTRWDFNNNRKNKVRKYHPKIWNKNRKEIKEKNKRNKVRKYHPKISLRTRGPLILTAATTSTKVKRPTSTNEVGWDPTAELRCPYHHYHHHHRHHHLHHH